MAALLIVTLGYLALNTPGRWFSAELAKSWQPRDLKVTLGSGRIDGDALHITALDASGAAVVILAPPPFRSSDYPGVQWDASGIPEGMQVELLWRTDVAPNRTFTRPIDIAGGQTLPTLLIKDGNWVGRITGIGLALRGQLTQSIVIGGVSIKPMSALDVAQDRIQEWFNFERWSATSINGLSGGAETQGFPLPLLLLLASALGALTYWGLARWRGLSFDPRIVAAMVVVCWIASDLHWLGNLVRQVAATGERFAGKSIEDKHRTSPEDGALFAFVDKAKAKLAASPARMFVVSDSTFLRGRAAYFLYPNNVYFEPRENVLPPRQVIRPGDYLFAYLRRGIQYDAKQHLLRWEGIEPLRAEVVATAPGGALFRFQ